MQSRGRRLQLGLTPGAFRASVRWQVEAPAPEMAARMSDADLAYLASFNRSYHGEAQAQYRQRNDCMSRLAYVGLGWGDE